MNIKQTMQPSTVYIKHAPHCPVNTRGVGDCRCTPVVTPGLPPEKWNRHHRRAAKNPRRDRQVDR